MAHKLTASKNNGGPGFREETRAVKAGDDLLLPGQDYHRPCGLNY
jgi:hypothetical protein